MLSKKKIRQLEKRLRQEMNELSEELKQAQEFGLTESLTASVGELSAYDNHPADLGAETFEREKDLSLSNAKKVRLAALEEALHRIEEGKYGGCFRCGRPIEDERLEVLPQAVNCIACQTQTEEENPRRAERPVEEELLAVPFARTFTPGDGENVAFDGEDAWQAVAQYGTAESPQDLGGNVDGFDEMYSDEPRGVVSAVENEQVMEEGLDEQLLET
ncbi:MAG: conjugal transfer protein TraR [Firmicutes bacterium]|nr:conjugal transfer protein TraR [Bacillota bacterium]